MAKFNEMTGFNDKFRLLTVSLLMVVSIFLSACGKSESPTDISDQFWSAVQERDMEAAKLVATWETVSYLKFLNTEKLHPERFELGEEMVGETRAEVETVLFTSKAGKSGIKLPGITVLVMTDNGWRVNVKKSMASVVKYSTNSVIGQLNGLMQEGIKGLDQSLSEAMNELGSTLEQGAEELKRELNKPLFAPKNQFEIIPDKQLDEDLRGKRI